MENLFLINIFLLVALLFYKEKKQEKIINNILMAKLSQNIDEFNSVVLKKPMNEDTEKIIKEIPLDDMSAEEILGVLQKNK